MNLHALDLPPDFQLETPRLRLIVPDHADGGEINASILASWNELRVWMPWAKTVPTEEESALNARGARWKWETRAELDFVLRLRDTNQVIGRCGLHTLESNVERAELGYWLDSRFCGRGLMGEAATRVVAFGVDLGFQRLEIRCDARNDASKNVARRLGFEHEGTLRRVRFDNDGKLCDLEIWARLF